MTADQKGFQRAGIGIFHGGMLGQLAKLPEGGRADPQQPAHLPGPPHPPYLMAPPDKKVGSMAGSRKFEPRGYNDVASFCRKSTGAIPPKFWWRLYAEFEMAPFRRKFTRAARLVQRHQIQRLQHRAVATGQDGDAPVRAGGDRSSAGRPFPAPDLKPAKRVRRRHLPAARRRSRRGRDR